MTDERIDLDKILDNLEAMFNDVNYDHDDEWMWDLKSMSLHLKVELNKETGKLEKFICSSWVENDYYNEFDIKCDKCNDIKWNKVEEDKKDE